MCVFHSLMDGIVESGHCSDSIVAGCSVACVVALLGSLEDLSQGRGLSDEHIECLSKVKDPDNWEAVYQVSDLTNRPQFGSAPMGGFHLT